MRFIPGLCAIGLSQSLVACDGPDYEPVSFDVAGAEFVARGVIDGSTLERFEEVSDAHPDISVLVLQQIEGSADDVANLAFSKVIRDAEFTTVVPSDGLVASGGTDLFLAGTTRILENGACVGVHSWSGGDVDGADLPRSDAEHQKYLGYYAEMGIDPAFYWFTLDAAPADSMHWMTVTEVDTFGLTSEAVGKLGDASACALR